jgi:uncharacterized protein YjbI with pentapeptide repeats
LKRLSPSDFEQTLEQHERFVLRKPSGRRALLGSHDLADADLTCRDVSHADFSNANPAGATLAGVSRERAAGHP